MSRVAERGEFPSPRMITISPPIDGVGPDGRTDMPRGVAITDAAQAQPLAERFASYRQIKAFSLLTPENLRALVRAATVPVTANCPNAMTFEEAVDAGVYCLDQLHNVARGHLQSDAPPPELWDRFDPLPGTRLDFGAIRKLARLLADKRSRRKRACAILISNTCRLPRSKTGNRRSSAGRGAHAWTMWTPGAAPLPRGRLPSKR